MGASGESLAITGLFAAAEFGTIGGGALRLKDNTSSTGGVASGGGAVTPIGKNRRSPAALSTWQGNSTTTITSGAVLNQRIFAGFAQTGGMGGYVPIVPSAAVQLLPQSTVGFNPTDLELTAITFSTSVTYDWLLEFGEGI